MNILIQWKSSFELGLKEIDQHHKKLVDLINVVYDSHVNASSSEMIKQVAAEMTDYAFVHFNYEEKYFKKFGYEYSEVHIKEHRNFLNKVDKLHADFWSANEDKKLEVLSFLKSWLEFHILNSDRKYVECFVKNGM